MVPSVCEQTRIIAMHETRDVLFYACCNIIYTEPFLGATYASWRPASGAMFSGAFSFHWGLYYFYAFHPISLIALCLFAEKHHITASKSAFGVSFEGAFAST